MFFQIAILAKGAASLQQEGRLAELTPGDMVIYENSRPFTWTFTEPRTADVLSVPSDAVRLTDSERGAMSAVRLSGRDGLSGVVARFVLDLIRHASDIPEAGSERVLAQASASRSRSPPRPPTRSTGMPGTGPRWSASRGISPCSCAIQP